MTEIPWNGYYENGRHYCQCGEATHYQMFSGGEEFYCEACDMVAPYPKGEGGPRARLLAQGLEGIALLKEQMDQELARLLKEKDD